MRETTSLMDSAGFEPFNHNGTALDLEKATTWGQTDGRRGKVTFYWTSTSIVVAGGARPSFGSTGTLHRYFLGRRPPSASRGTDRKKSQCTTTFFIFHCKDYSKKNSAWNLSSFGKKGYILKPPCIVLNGVHRGKKDKFYFIFLFPSFQRCFLKRKNYKVFLPPLVPLFSPVPFQQQCNVKGKLQRKSFSQTCSMFQVFLSIFGKLQRRFPVIVIRIFEFEGFLPSPS